jgi:RNA polymerase sigma factor (sigma-70 family)
MSKVDDGSERASGGAVRLAGRALLATQSDERLVELARRGSEPAFEAIVERYRGPLGRYCRGLVAPSRVDDILQHTFLSAYRTVRSDGRDLTLKPWLYRVAHNAALDALRRDARGFEQLDESYDGVERPDQALERKESLRALIAGLSGLPQRQRAALVLRELEGRSYKEIERELALNGGSLRQLLYRARSNLRTVASAVTPPALFLRPEVPLGIATGAGAAKAGAVVATTAVIGAVALSSGPGKPDADAAEKNGGGGSALMGAPSSSETTEGRDPWATASERRRARSDAGGRRTPRRSAEGAPTGDGAGPKVRPGTGSPGLDAGEAPAGADDSPAGDDSPGGDDAPGGDDSPGGDDGFGGGDDGLGGGDDGSAPAAPNTGGGGDDVEANSAPPAPSAPAVPGNPLGEEPDDED